MTTTDVAPALVGTVEPVPTFAAWWRRVVAALVDGGTVSLVAFLVDGAQPDDSSFVPFLGGLVVQLRTSPAAIGTVLVLLALQAWTGQTPGKRVTGIVVVREADGRPLGPGWTLVREVAHVADWIPCGLGFLRPLWHPRARTLADSVVRSDVLRGTDPPGGPPMGWNATALRRLVVDLAVFVLAVVVLLGSGTSGSRVTGEQVDRSWDALPQDGAVSIATVAVHDPGEATTTRLGVTRTVPDDAPVEITVTVVPAADARRSPSAVHLEVALVGAAGTVLWQGAAAAGADSTTSFAVPRSAFSARGPSWACVVRATVDGVVQSERTAAVSGG